MDIRDRIFVEVENMGGIRTKEVEFTSGVNVLAGPNATNRTSLLRAIGGALGGTAGVLRRGADSGSVTLEVDGDEWRRQYQRTGNAVRTAGNPYTEDSRLVDLFVCLLEDNPIRRAVRSGGDLTELLLDPVDMDELEREIASLQTKRDRIDEQLTEIDRERKRLPKLEERRTTLKTELDEIKSELEALRDQAKDVERGANESTELESIRTELQAVQTELEKTESELETQRTIRDELKTELKDVREELPQHEADSDDLSGLEQDIERLQRQEAEISAVINELSTVLKQNREVLAGDDTIITELAATDDLLGELNPQNQSFECWTCGSHVQRQDISGQLEDIKQLVERKRTERNEIRETLSEKKSQRDSIQQEIERYETLTEREQELQNKLEERGESIENLTAKVSDLRDELSDKQSALEETKQAEEGAEVEIYGDISELEYRRGQVKSDLQEVEEEINGIEYQIGKYDNLEERREGITEELHDLRTRVENIERETVDNFNSHMKSVLDRLGYNNIERVWLERRSTDAGTTFDLHIVRKDDDGRVYEDSVNHLSESEREVVGLVVALTGYLTHDVEQDVPFILLDSLEAIDADRIAELTRYISSHTEFLFLALLEEDAAKLPESYEKLRAVEQLA